MVNEINTTVPFNVTVLENPISNNESVLLPPIINVTQDLIDKANKTPGGIIHHNKPNISLPDFNDTIDESSVTDGEDTVING